MDCTYFRTLASASVDNEITAEERALLDEHIEVCPDCGAWLSAFEALHAELPSLAVEAPPELRARVSKSLSMMTEKKPSFFSRYKFTAIAAAAAIAIFALSGSFENYLPHESKQAAQDYEENILYNARTVPDSSQMDSQLAIATPELLEKAIPYSEEFAFILTIHDDFIPNAISQITPEIREDISYYIVDSSMSSNLIAELDHKNAIYSLTFNQNDILPHGLVIIE